MPFSSSGPHFFRFCSHNSFSGGNIVDQKKSVVASMKHAAGVVIRSLLNDYLGLRPNPGVDDTEFFNAFLSVAAYFALLVVSWLLSVVDSLSSGPTIRFGRMTAALQCASLLFFASTWYYILSFLGESRDSFIFANAVGMRTVTWEHWVIESDWFVEAYAMVSSTPLQWFYSGQLLQFVVSLVVFMFAENRRADLKFVFFQIVSGCLGAISLSLPLTICAVMNSPDIVSEARHNVRRSWVVVLCSVVSSAAITIAPSLLHSRDGFGAVIWVLHLSVVLPLVLSQVIPKCMYRDRSAVKGGVEDSDVFAPSSRSCCHWLTALYGALCGMSLVLLIQHWAQSVQYSHNEIIQKCDPMRGEALPFGSCLAASFLHRVLVAPFANYCQTSISLDLLNCSVCFAVLLLWGSPLSQYAQAPVDDSYEGSSLIVGTFRQRLGLVATIPVLGLSVVFPFYLCWRELCLASDSSPRDAFVVQPLRSPFRRRSSQETPGGRDPFQPIDAQRYLNERDMTDTFTPPDGSLRGDDLAMGGSQRRDGSPLMQWQQTQTFTDGGKLPGGTPLTWSSGRRRSSDTDAVPFSSPRLERRNSDKEKASDNND